MSNPFDFRSFITVAERQSFSRAAVDLRVSPSALSQTVRRLESQLGVRLFDRTTRSVALTDVGRKLLERLRPLLGEMDAALAEAAQSSGRIAGPLRVAVPRVAAARFIAPILANFRESYPEVELEISLDDHIRDIVADRFDAGIRLGERLQQDMIAIKLGGEMRSAVVASPAFLARHGVPLRPRELIGMACNRFRQPTNGAVYDWEFETEGEEMVIAVDGPLIVNDVRLMLNAAKDGIGLAYALEQDALPFIDGGQLVKVLAEYCPVYPGFYLYHHASRLMAPALAAFIKLAVANASN